MQNVCVFSASSCARLLENNCLNRNSQFIPAQFKAKWSETKYTKLVDQIVTKFSGNLVDNTQLPI